MNLNELRQILTESRPHQWWKLDATGPLYRNGWVMTSGGGREGHDLEVTWHHEAAVYRDDIDLTIQWGMDMDPGDDDRRHFDWAEKFINPKVHPWWVDVFWRGVLVDRYGVVSVDGGHGLVPFPHTAGESPDWHNAVTEREVAVVHLVDHLGGGHDRSVNYIQQVGFRVVPDQD